MTLFSSLHQFFPRAFFLCLYSYILSFIVLTHISCITPNTHTWEWIWSHVEKILQEQFKKQGRKLASKQKMMAVNFVGYCFPKQRLYSLIHFTFMFRIRALHGRWMQFILVFIQGMYTQWANEIANGNRHVRVNEKQRQTYAMNVHQTECTFLAWWHCSIV